MHFSLEGKFFLFLFVLNEPEVSERDILGQQLTTHCLLCHTGVQWVASQTLYECCFTHAVFCHFISIQPEGIDSSNFLDPISWPPHDPASAASCFFVFRLKICNLFQSDGIRLSQQPQKQHTPNVTYPLQSWSNSGTKRVKDRPETHYQLQGF